LGLHHIDENCSDLSQVMGFRMIANIDDILDMAQSATLGGDTSLVIVPMVYY